jgi:methylated-DNA-protein-cysteine methyltransferase-like protein
MHMSYELPDPHSFYTTVWEIVQQIPYGKVATYGQIAMLIPVPDGIEPMDYQRLGARWVGDAMNAVSRIDEPTIPWHRVINSKGGISIPLESPSSALQRGRLRHEGVEFDAKERVNLDIFRWDGPDAAWLEERGLLLNPSPKKPPTEGPQQLTLL